MSIDEHRAIRDCTPRYSICSDISRDKIIHKLWIILSAFTRALAALRIFPQRPWGRGCDSSHCNQRNQEEQYAQCVKFINFQEVTEHEIKNVIDKVGKKSCELDPVPAKIFQGCQKTLLPIITKISNESLQSGCMPEKLKEAVLKPKLKKDSLEYEEYTNFRPISNLKFLSKVIEKVAAGSFWNIWLITT